MYETSRAVLEQTVQDCIQCGICSDAVCHGRTYTGTVGEAAQEVLDACDKGESPSYDIERLVWGCSLCGGCTADCPVEISAPDVYAAARDCLCGGQAAETEAYSYLRVDRKHHTFALLREVDGIDYEDYLLDDIDAACPDTGHRGLFFPGCSLSTYASSLTRTVYDWLVSVEEVVGMTALCCGRPIESMGSIEVFDAYVDKLFARLEQRSIERLIIACPNCYYALKRVAKRLDSGVVMELLPDVLLRHGKLATSESFAGVDAYALHDSCPDRFDGVIKTGVKRLLEKTARENGAKHVEMEHGGLHTICCGSGGLVGNYDPSICDIRAAARMSEVKASGADCLVCACINCASTFVQQDDGMPIRHYLELVFGESVDWTEVGHSSQRLSSKLTGEEIGSYFADKTNVL